MFVAAWGPAFEPRHSIRIFHHVISAGIPPVSRPPGCCPGRSCSWPSAQPGSGAAVCLLRRLSGRGLRLSVRLLRLILSLDIAFTE